MRYFIGFLVTIGLIILAFILLLHGSSTPGGQAGKLDLTKYASSDTQMRMTIKNPNQSDQTHREVQVTVGKDYTTFNIFQGYQQHVVTTKTYANNSSSYNEFLAALQRAGYTKGDTSKANSSELGFCPLGDTYVYEVLNGDQDSQRFWSTSCGQGNFKGNRNVVQSLFKTQVPDYFSLTSDIVF